MIKIRDCYTINFMPEAAKVLRILGYIDGNKKSKGKLSEFISRLVINNFENIAGKTKKEILEKYLKFELVESQKKRDKIEESIQLTVEKIKKIKSS